VVGDLNGNKAVVRARLVWTSISQSARSESLRAGNGHSRTWGCACAERRPCLARAAGSLRVRRV